MKGPARRLLGAAAILGIAGCGVALVLLAFRENLLYFYYPSQIARGDTTVTGRDIRVGGLVVADSVQRSPGGLVVRFALTDHESQLHVHYEGILPALFREGQGAIVTGRVRPDGVFAAAQVLARHDENYVPPELAELVEHSPGPPAGAYRPAKL